ncbi:MAG: hypothetical protein MUF15_21800, partial [Acidobacteria bacterium]|nr:hypothetical protein [Acidobacteriota bacterium]
LCMGYQVPVCGLHLSSRPKRRYFNSHFQGGKNKNRYTGFCFFLFMEPSDTLLDAYYLSILPRRI